MSESQLFPVFVVFGRRFGGPRKSRDPRFGPKEEVAAKTHVFSFGHFFEKVCFSNFEGAEKESPESPKVIRAASISVAFRKKRVFSQFCCVFVFDAKCEKQEVTRGAGPQRTKKKPPKTKQLSVQITVFSHFEIRQTLAC